MSCLCVALPRTLPAGGSVALPHVLRAAGVAHSLLVGDSIANFGSGYAGNVKRLLGATAVPGGNGPANGGPNANAAVSAPRAYPQGSGFCGSSFGVLGCAGFWLGEELHYKWDVIHFNWGLHDVDACELSDT